jgi:hypothetical protein
MASFFRLLPPSKMSTTPVIWAEALLERKIAIPAISSGDPRRPYKSLDINNYVNTHGLYHF